MKGDSNIKMSKKIIQQGAEAIIYLSNEGITKERIKKSYRYPELDKKIRKQRTKHEIKLIQKLKNSIKVPEIKKEIIDESPKIIMEYIEGKKLSENLYKLNYKKICKKIGESIAKMHNENIIHGDLTTSNMILKKDEIYFIDFGLGFISTRIEDKAVDLHLLKHALETKHNKISIESFKAVLEGYKKSNQFKEIITQLQKVECRGRYKEHY